MSDKSGVGSINDSRVRTISGDPHWVIRGQFYYRCARSCVRLSTLRDSSTTKDIIVVFYVYFSSIFPGCDGVNR